MAITFLENARVYMCRRCGQYPVQPEGCHECGSTDTIRVTQVNAWIIREGVKGEIKKRQKEGSHAVPA